MRRLRRRLEWRRRARTLLSEHPSSNGRLAVEVVATWLRAEYAFTIQEIDGRARIQAVSRYGALRIELGERLVDGNGALMREGVDDIVARGEIGRGFVPFVDYVGEGLA